MQMNQAINERVKTVAIFGATGAQGKPVVEQAIAQGLKVRAISRSGDFGVDLNQQASIEAVLQGVDAAFLHLPMPQSPEQPVQWLANFINAAHAVKLPHLVFSTSGYGSEGFRSSPIIDGNKAATQALLGCGIPTIVLQPTIYLENLLVGLFVPQLRESGVLDYPPLPRQFGVHWTSQRDQAIIACAALQRPDLAGQCFPIASHQALNGSELAVVLRDFLNRPVAFTPLSPSAFGDRVASAIGNPGIGFVLGDMYAAVAQSQPNSTRIDVEKLEAVFGVKLGSVSSRLKEMFHPMNKV
jgi:NAD(P)H dehydrogenase (quinone)